MYEGKGDPLVCGSYRAIKLLEQPMKVLESVLKKNIRCQVSIDNMPFSSCAKYKRNTKQRISCNMLLWIWKRYLRGPEGGVRWL